jgi:hypothetical protein
LIIPALSLSPACRLTPTLLNNQYDHYQSG